jgi:hypothetical protein
MSTEKIYAAMRQSEMCNWVGGGDPAAVGAINFTSIIENLPLRRGEAVLDFGCGRQASYWRSSSTKAVN